MLQTQTVYPATLGIIKKLMNDPMLNNFYLVGGTALALQIGHRISVDIDLFTNEPFDSVQLSAHLKQNYDFEEKMDRGYFLQGNIEGVKIDLLKYTYKPLNPLIEIEDVRMVDRADISTMKLSAITNRGRKRDFIDLFFLLKEFSLTQIIELYKQKFNSEVFMLIQSLVYFDDAEGDIDLNMIKKINWKDVKYEINKQVQNYLKS
jgi:hypothetical protein